MGKMGARVGTADLKDDSVTSAKILDGTIVQDDIATGEMSRKRVIERLICSHAPHAFTGTSYAYRYDADNIFIVELDPAEFDKATYYFEAVFRNAATGKYAYVELWNYTEDEAVNVANGYGVASEVKATVETVSRLRSAAFTPKTGSNNYAIKVKVDSGGSGRMIMAKIIIVQEE